MRVELVFNSLTKNMIPLIISSKTKREGKLILSREGLNYAPSPLVGEGWGEGELCLEPTSEKLRITNYLLETI